MNPVPPPASSALAKPKRPIRKTIFRLHLLAGILAGIVIAIMSFTASAPVLCYTGFTLAYRRFFPAKHCPT